MSLLLAFDTSTPRGSVALADAGRVLSAREIGSEVRHAESLLPAIAAVLEAAGCTPAALDGIVVGGGPGSFTGVRVAAATARGLVRALGVPLYAYGSLLAETRSADRAGEPVCALFDARRGEVYAACHTFGEGGWTTLLEPAALALDDVVARLRAVEPLWRGSAVPAGKVADARMTRAEALLRLAREAPAAGRIERPGAWEPEYLRPPGAERIRR